MNPWMSDTEIAKIKKYLDPKYTFLEWGSGGSTIYFSKFVKQYISIEYDINWFNQINLYIKNEDINNIKYIYCPPDNDILLPIYTDRSEEKDFISYVNIVDTLSKNQYDIVLIDGRSRVNCANKILKYIHKQSIVFIHDFFNRPKYFSVLDNYDLIDSVTDGQSLAVLKKKS
jgi:hypothetical protein